MNKKIVFVSLAFVVTSMASGQNKGPVHGRTNVDTLHHHKSTGLLKGKQISTTKGSSANKLRRKDSLKAMNDPMTKLEKPGHDSSKLSKPATYKKIKLSQQKKEGVK